MSNSYHMKLHHFGKKIKCPSCYPTLDIVISAQHMEKHYKEHHNLNPAVCCIWCKGEYSWPKRQKMLHIDHLIQCFQLFTETTDCVSSVTENYQKFNMFSTSVRTCTKSLSCPECRASVLARDMESHAQTVHQFNTKLKCVWCWGLYTWELRQKGQHVNHLEQCFQKALSAPIQESIESTVKSYSCDTIDMCRARDFFGKPKLFPDWMYEPLWTMPDEVLVSAVEGYPNQFEFEGTVQTASQYFKVFESQKFEQVYHICVRAVAMESFLKNMKDKLWTCPFWCWCDGGKQADPWVRHHRHMIAFTSNVKEFNKAWNKIRLGVDQSETKNIFSKPIKSALHFINVLGYVSKMRSKCQLSEDRKMKDNHYFIGTALPNCMYECLSALKEDGLLDLVNRRYRQQNLVLEFDKAYRSPTGGWVLKIKDLPDLQRNMVLPVKKGWVPTDRVTDAWLELTGGKKLYFERETPREMSREEWIRQQGESGNNFYDCIHDSEYKFSRTQQLCIDCCEKWMTLFKNAMASGYGESTLILDNLTLKREYEKLQDRYRKICNKHMALQQENLTMNEKNRGLKRKHKSDKVKWEEKFKRSEESWKRSEEQWEEKWKKSEEYWKKAEEKWKRSEEQWEEKWKKSEEYWKKEEEKWKKSEEYWKRSEENLQNQIQELKHELKLERQKNEEKQAEIDRLKAYIDKMVNDKIEALTKENEKLKAYIDKLINEKIDGLVKENQELKRRLDQEIKEKEELKIKVQELTLENQQLRAENARLVRRLNVFMERAKRQKLEE